MKLKKIIATILTTAMMTTVVSGISMPQTVQAAEYEAYTGNDLGATYTSSKTTFKVWAPTASSVQIKRYKTGSDSEAGAGVIETKDMIKGSQNVWSIEISGDLKNTYYTYIVDGRETPDVYGRTTGINGDRSMVIDLDSTDPVGWDSDSRVESPNQTDAIVWEVHVKDFSYSQSSGIDAKYRGKFMAFTQTGTTLNGNGITKTGIDHLKELGVTHVQILPMYDYASVDERNSDGEVFNWGYDPKNYNVPEGSYSTNPYDGNVRVKELKEMVKALHDAGIGVVMDVVYNHTYAPFGQGGSQNDFQKQQYSPLDRTVPGYYYTSTDWSGCGNSTDSTKAMYRKYMIDSLVYWATEYHLDGFRFDLMGIHDVNTMNQIREALNKVDPKIKMWGEPWCGDGSKNSLSGYANKANCKSLDNNIAMFSDNARDAIKGNTWDGKLSNAGWVTGNGNRQTEVIAGIKAQCGDYSNINQNIWSKQPSQVITYTSCHDNHALYDILCMTMGYSQNGSRYDDIVSMNKVASAIVLTSQGISFMQAGEEFGRSKNGDHNSYQSPASVNQLDWNRLKTFSDLSNYYKGLIEIRKNFSAFRDPTTSAGNRINWLNTSGNTAIGYTLTNNTQGEWNKIACLFNVSSSSTNIYIDGNWVVIANDTKAGTESLGTVSGNVSIPGRSAMILVEKSTFDNTVIGKKGTVIVNHVDENGNIIKSETKSGKAGTSYNTSPLVNDEYILVNTPNNASGKFTEGTITVTYTYKKDTTPRGTVIVKYVDKVSGKEIATKTEQSGKEGTSYTTSPLTIKGYDLDSSSIPTNASGKYTQGTITVTYYYIEKEVKNLKVHYYNANNWSNVYLYAYNESTGTAVQYTGAWPGTKMTSEGNNWYVYDVTEAEVGQIIFNDGGSNKEPSGASAPGYNAEGEVWVKDGVVSNENPNAEGTVITKYIDEDTNKEIAQSETTTGKVGDSYSTSSKTIEGYTLTEKPSNASGKYTKATITVVYKYKKNVDKKLIINTFDTNLQSPQLVGKSINIVADAEGDGTVKYKFEVYYEGQLEEQSSFSTVNSYSWNPTVAGEYTLKVKVTDNSGKVISETMNYDIKLGGEVLKITSFTTNVASPQEVGKAITLSASATGSGTVRYHFYAYLNGKVVQQSALSTAKTYSWKPTKAGTYTLKVVATDSTGKIVSTTKSYVVKATEPITITSLTSSVASPQNAGKSITFTTKATGQTTLQYQYWICNVDGSWTKLKSYSTTATATWKPTVSGDYIIWVDVKDTKGNVKSKYVTYKINPQVTKIEESYSGITYTGTWKDVSVTNASGGKIKRATSTAKASFSFTGTGVKMYSTVASNMGIAKVTVDGTSYMVDLYASSSANKKCVFTKTGLTNKKHTVIIEYLGLGNLNSTGTAINIDYFELIK